MKQMRQCSSAANSSKRLLPFILLAGLALFFLLSGQELFAFSQLTENYATLKAFVDGKLATALFIFGATYVVTVALSLPIA